jgi:hypothetical protein
VYPNGITLINYDKMKTIYDVICHIIAHQQTYNSDDSSYVSTSVTNNFIRSLATSPTPLNALLISYVSEVIFMESDEESLIALSDRIKPYPV